MEIDCRLYAAMRLNNIPLCIYVLHESYTIFGFSKNSRLVYIL